MQIEAVKTRCGDLQIRKQLWQQSGFRSSEKLERDMQLFRPLPSNSNIREPVS